MDSKKESTSNVKVILINSATWEDWNERFQTQAIMYDLLKYVQGKEDLISKPKRPNMAIFPMKKDVAQPQTQSTATETPETVEDDMISFVDLTHEGQKAFNMAWSYYQDDLKLFEKQQEYIRKLKEWISANVSAHLQKTCCKSSDSLPKWYENLRKAAGITKRLEDANARAKYHEALKPPKLKDLPTWVDEWEQAMTTAKDKEVLATTRVSEWFEDFLVVLRGLIPMWAEAYSVNKDPMVDDNSLDFRTVANDLRKVASQYAKKAKLAKGSFGPTFAGEEDQHVSGSQENPVADNEDKKSSKRKRKEKRRSKKKQGKDNPESEELSTSEAPPVKRRSDQEKVCRACQGFHYTQNCFYVFQKKAPESWTPNPRIQKLVDKALKENQSLKDDVDRWMKDIKKEKDD